MGEWLWKYPLLLTLLAFRGAIAAMLEVGCRLLLIAGCRETLQLSGDARGCNGHRRRRMVQTTTYPGTMPVAFAREGEAARNSRFLRCSWTSGMPPGLTTLTFKS